MISLFRILNIEKAVFGKSVFGVGCRYSVVGQCTKGTVYLISDMKLVYFCRLVEDGAVASGSVSLSR